MEESRSKANVIKPVILKAGIPLVITAAGFIWAKIIATRRKTTDDNSFHGVDSGSCNEEEADLVREKPGIQEELLGLGRIVESLQEREWKLETQFLWYCELRDREALLLEIGNALELELGRVEALSREVSDMENEHKRVAEIALACAEVLEEVRRLKLENRVTQRKVKKLSRKVRGQASCVRESNLRLAAQEREISETRSALESETDTVKRMEGEIRELRRALEQLQQEKGELRIKLSSIEESVLKTKREGASIEDFKQLLKELEQLQKEQAAEEKELIYLRWSNACLRHDVMRNHINHTDDHESCNFLVTKTNSSELEVPEEAAAHRSHDSDQEGPSPGSQTGKCNHHFSRRKRLLQKLRKWVEGNEHDHVRAKGRVGEAYEHRIVPARRSCSSA